MKKYLLICLVMLFGNLAFSQNNTERNTKNSLGLQIGYDQGFLKDLNFSPLNYTEGGALFGLNYRRQNPDGKGRLDVGFEFSSAQLKTKASEYLTSNLIFANFEISYLRKVAEKNQLSFYLGGQYSSYLHISDWHDFDAFSYLASHGIGIKGLLSYDLNPKHRFSTSLYLPVFEFIARPPYNGIDEQTIENQDNIPKIIFTSKPASLNKYLAFEWRINYHFTLSKRFDLSATYLLRFQNLSEINKVIHLQNQLSVGVNFKF